MEALLWGILMLTPATLTLQSGGMFSFSIVIPTRIVFLYITVLNFLLNSIFLIMCEALLRYIALHQQHQIYLVSWFKC